MGETVAGLIVKLGESLHFVPAEVAQRVVQRPVLSEVPGADLQMALIGGRVVAVIDVGPARDELVVCNVAGEDVAFSGLSVQSSSSYEKIGDQVRFGDQLVPRFDAESELGRTERRLWGGQHREGDAEP